MTPQRSAQTKRWFAATILLAMLLGACEVPPTPPMPTAIPPAATRTAASTALAAVTAAPTTVKPTNPPPTRTARPTIIPPTPTPGSSPTPLNLADLPMPAPRLLYFSPSWGQEQPLDAPIVLTFDQPMDQASVEQALTLSPSVTGTYAWSGAQTVAFTPNKGLQRGQTYRVHLAGSARNAAGELLQEPASFEFNTVGYLGVVEVQPSPGSGELDPNTSITVVFNRPVVPLTYIGDLPNLPQPLKLTPSVRGKGEWLNTSIYVFRPEQGLQPSTRYTATVAAGLVDTIGGLLPADYTWSFTTFQPAVRSFVPRNGADCIYLNQVISVTFNQPMDHASVQEHFALTDKGRPVAGTFRWSGGETPTAPETMGFVPQEPLSRATNYAVRVSAGCKPRAGTATLERTTAWSFTTIGNPGVVGITPAYGATGVELHEGVKVTYGSPMRKPGFLDYVTISPTVPLTSVNAYFSSCGNVVTINFPKRPAATYTVTVDARAPDYYGLPAGMAARTQFTTKNLLSYAYLNTSGLTGTFNAYSDTLVYASYRNVTRLDLTLHRVSPGNFMDLLGYGNTNVRDYRPAASDLVRAWSITVSAPANKGRTVRIDLTDEKGGRLPTGLYLLKMSAPGVGEPSYFLFSRSQINLTAKLAPHQTLIWATDLADGSPVPNLPLKLHYRSATPAATGATDADGLYRNETWGEKDKRYTFFAVAGTPGQDDFSIAYDEWSNGIAPYDFKVGYDYNVTGVRGYVYTERPIYRPGQTVYFKGIVRNNDDAHYSLPPAGQTVRVTIQDPDGKEVYNQNLTLSSMGTISGELALGEEASLGTYYVYMGGNRYWDASGYTTFRVAEYKKPEFQVEVKAARPAYSAGETVDVTAIASYYFGGAVSDAAVHWSVLSEDYYFSYVCPQGKGCPWYSWSENDPWYDYWDDWDEYGEDYENPYGRLIAEGDGKTDEQGRVTFQVAGDISKETASQVLTIEASVTDLNGQQVSNRSGVVVHKGDFYIGVAPRGYLAQAGKEKEIDLITVGWDSAPTARVPLTVVLLERRWYSVRRQEENGSYYWTWTVQETPVLTQTVTTGADGKAVVALTPPKGGSYRVRAVGRDARGNEIRSSAFFWVWGGEGNYWRRESNNRIELVADKREYQVGDTAEILIPSPFSGTVYALITIERGHILETAVRELHSSSEVLWIEIKEDYVPNIYVSVVLVQGSAVAADGLATFKMGLVNLPVSNKVKELQVTLTPDRSMERGEHYAPRQTATYDLYVTDSYGKPVEAEFSLRLADLAVLALANEAAPPLLGHFWYSRGIAVRTSMPLAVAMEPYNREIKPGEKGGGGEKGTPEEGFIRTRFADTAYWAPAVRTNADGRARVTVELPDNLTTWRMQAIGITADTRVGRTDVDVQTTLDVLVRSVLPRFFVVGDRARIGTIVHNNTPEALEVRVEVAAEGLALEGPSAVTVTVPAGDKVRVNWPVAVPAVEKAVVRMTAQAGRYFDGREDTLPVYRYSTPEVVATAGRLSEAGYRQELVQLPPIFDPTQGDLTVQIDGSLTASTRDALTYLEHYPYECTEQTVSRFLPNVLTYQVLQEMELSNPELEANLERLVGVALQRLYKFQHYDGGWGWWLNDPSNTYLTAYVLQGMLEARRAGFAVDKGAMARGVTFLRRNMSSPSNLKQHWEANRAAYILYVLAEYHAAFETGTSPELSSAVGLFEKRHLLSRYGQATLAVALSLLEPAEPSRQQTLLDDLSGDAVMSATGTHWEEDKPDYWNMNTDIRSTAIVLWAMARLEPRSERLPNIVRWLMAVRKEGYWRTTNTTAWSLLALVAYMRASGEMEGDYSYNVYLNGVSVLEGSYTKENLDETRTLTIEIAKLLVEETNRLVIERRPAGEGQTGLGQLYYTVHLRYFLPVERIKALNRGILVAREYSLVDKPGEPVSSAQVGDVIRVKLTLVAPTDLYYVVVEDPLPAGCEGVDTSLLTTSVVGEKPELRNVTAEETNRWYRRFGWGWWWFSHTEMRDEKVALFATYMPRGTYEYTYMMRASVPGEFLVLPATAYQMYFPEVFGRSDGAQFQVEEGE